MYARYTEYLRDLMQNEQTKAALDKALSSYPLHQPEKLYDLIPTREELNKRILNHYKYREIGFETPGRFLDELEITMNEIMPYYNERFKTIETMADIENPFDTVDYVETFEQEQTNSAKTSGTSTAKNNGSVDDESSSTGKTTTKDVGSDTSSVTAHSKDVESDTPQDSLSITAENIDGVDYASKVNWNKSNSEGSNNHDNTVTNDSESSGTNKRTTSDNSEGSSNTESESSGTVKHTFTKKGAMGVTTFGHDMIEFRDSIIDVMNEIVTDQRLNELFMMVY